MRAKLILAASAFAVILVGEAAAEPASADPSFRAVLAHPRAAASLADFTAAGALVSICARGRGAMIDTQESFENLEDSRAMKGFMPGFPQPANVSFDLRIWF